MHDQVDMRPTVRVKRVTDEATGQDLMSKERFEFLPSIKDRAFYPRPKNAGWLR